MRANLDNGAVVHICFKHDRDEKKNVVATTASLKYFQTPEAPDPLTIHQGRVRKHYLDPNNIDKARRAALTKALVSFPRAERARIWEAYNMRGIGSAA